jgi:hypothetical protein
MGEKRTGQPAKFLIQVVDRGLAFQVVQAEVVQEVEGERRLYPLVAERIQPELQKLIFIVLSLAATVAEPHLVNSICVAHCERDRV